jgi:hypothetical protein
MTSAINKEEILRAVQSMTGEERLKLIAEIADVPDAVEEPAIEEASLSQSPPDQEAMKFAGEFIAHHKTLLRRLAE